MQLHVDACVPLAYLLNGCKGPSFATMEARFTRPTGTGAHLSTSGLEFDERLLKAVSDDFGLRLAANVDFPRAVFIKFFARRYAPKESTLIAT